MINEDSGVVLYMNQENSNDAILNKLKAYAEAKDPQDVLTKMDARDYGIGAQILRSLGVRNIRLISNNPTKRIGIDAFGLKIVDAIPIA